MDLHFQFRGLRFSWNTEKASSTVDKHGVTFEQACEIFLDPFLQLVEAHAEDEQRDAAIGFAEDWSLLFVVHLLRQGSVIRIISARKATGKERRHYENSI